MSAQVLSNVHAELLLSDFPQIPQATGMLSVQLGGSVTSAEFRMRTYAVEVHRPLSEVACDIVARRLWLSPTTGWQRRAVDGTPNRV